MDVLLTNMSIDEYEKASDEVLQNFPAPVVADLVDDVLAARNELKTLIIEKNFEFSKVTEALRSKGDTIRIKNFIDKLTKRKVMLLYSILIEINTPYGEYVKGFDWVLKLITGTDALKSVRKPVVQLQLTTVDSSGIKKKNVYDIGKDTLSKIISKLGNLCADKN